MDGRQEVVHGSWRAGPADHHLRRVLVVEHVVGRGAVRRRLQPGPEGQDGRRPQAAVVRRLRRGEDHHALRIRQRHRRTSTRGQRAPEGPTRTFEKTWPRSCRSSRIQADKDALTESRPAARTRSRRTARRSGALVQAGKFAEAQTLSKAKNRPLIDKIAATLDTVMATQAKQLDAGQGGRRRRRHHGQGHRRSSCCCCRPRRGRHGVGRARRLEPAARSGQRDAVERRAGVVGLDAGGQFVAVAVAGRHRTGGVARGDVGVDGGDGVDDAQERRERADAPPDWCRKPKPAVKDSNAALGDMVDGDERHPRVERQDRQDHQDDRRDRVPDQHPRAQRGGRSRPRRRGGHGLRGGGRRSAQPGAAVGAGGQGHGGPDRRRHHAVARRATPRSSTWPSVIGAITDKATRGAGPRRRDQHRPAGSRRRASTR